MSEWKETTIEYTCKDVLTGGTPLSSVKEYYENGNIPWLKTKEVNFNRIFSTENYINTNGLENSSAKLIPSNSVIVAMYGQGDTAGRVAINKIPLTTNQACCNLIIDENKANHEFIYYFLSNSYEELVSRKTGSAQPNLNTKLIKDFPVLLPPLENQKSIAAILSSLDDKIDLLHRQNATLEKMAETLFRQWFIEEAKEDWEEIELGNLIDVVIDNRGKTPPTVEYSTDYPLIEVNALNSNSCLVDYTVIRKYVIKDTFESWFRKHLKINDIIISTVGTIGVFSIHLANKGCIAQNLVGLRSNKISSYFLYNFFKTNIETLISLDIGGVQPSIKVPHLLGLTLKLPEMELLNKYDESVRIYFDKIAINQTQIRTLTTLRDMLLPKLMSGEVRVEM